MESLIGHEAIRRELRALALSDEPPHALMFVGPDGTGRSLLALEYAQMLNCERSPKVAPAGGSLFDDPGLAPPVMLPCNECRPCRLIAEGAHPDVVALGPGDTLCKPRPNESGHERHPQSRDIRICQVRGLIELVSRYPFEARYRSIVIDPADRLGVQSQHAILKTLEEPPGHTVIALITSAPEALLETVRSRCRRIEVGTLPRQVIEDGLIAHGVAAEVAALAAEESRGRPGRAVRFAATPDLMGDRARLQARCAKVAASKISERLSYAEDLADRFRRDRNAVHAELEAWELFWEGRLREAAADGGRGEAEHVVEALRAIGQAREDLLANVLARPALELMLLRFPAVTLEAIPGEEPATYA